ncbi:hypothetical protein CYG49_01555 [Candidatus Saccharibacteria bacterium]|nr:MAG: hypothetical protein CYG49_01555 [Candidatus Saccharibacteria bacterium]
MYDALDQLANEDPEAFADVVLAMATNDNPLLREQAALSVLTLIQNNLPVAARTAALLCNDKDDDVSTRAHNQLWEISQDSEHWSSERSIAFLRALDQASQVISGEQPETVDLEWTDPRAIQSAIDGLGKFGDHLTDFAYNIAKIVGDAATYPHLFTEDMFAFLMNHSSAVVRSSLVNILANNEDLLRTHRSFAIKAWQKLLVDPHPDTRGWAADLFYEQLFYDGQRCSVFESEYQEIIATLPSEVRKSIAIS